MKNSNKMPVNHPLESREIALTPDMKTNGHVLYKPFGQSPLECFNRSLRKQVSPLRYTTRKGGETPKTATHYPVNHPLAIATLVAVGGGA